MKKTVQKFMALTFGLGAAVTATGCAVDGATDEDLGSIESSFTRQDTGVCATHVQVAAEIVRTAMVDLGRYRPGLDLVKNQGKVALTAGGLARCNDRGGCPRLKSLLSYQYLNNMQTDALSAEFPWMKNLQTAGISDAIASSMSDYLNPRPDAVMSHDLTFHHISPAAPLGNCSADLKYHCFSVSGLPAGKTVGDLASNLRNLFSANPNFAQMSRVFNENGYLCIDPDGTGDDQTGGGSTGGSTCVDGTMAISYDPAFVGNCCALPAGNGYLVQSTLDTGYMSCKLADVAAGKVATASSALASNLPANVTDADPNTSWKAGTANANEWARVDLGVAQNIKGVAFKFETPGAYGYKLETSANGFSWVMKKVGTSAANAGWQDVSFVTTSARYVRVTFTSLPAGRSAAIGSMRVFN
ncbi:MAG: discoidin protein [Polyangiaceae bacterium]|nr:discoidin protein [Polyangiaceae bacterium]